MLSQSHAYECSETNHVHHDSATNAARGSPIGPRPDAQRSGHGGTPMTFATEPAMARIARRLGVSALVLLTVGTGTAAAHGTDGAGGGVMDGSWGVHGGAMGLWGLLWMGVLLAVAVAVAYALLDRGDDGDEERSLTIVRERYARGELTDEEYQQRLERLEGPR